MKIDALVPVLASVVGIYLTLRSGYLRAVLAAPFRRARRHRPLLVVDALEFDFDAVPVTTAPQRELEPHRHSARLHS